MKNNIIPLLLGVILSMSGVSAWGAPVTDAASKALNRYLGDVRINNKGFVGFNAETGRKMFFAERRHNKKNELRSCTTCHTKDLGAKGKTPVGKPIDPISPSVNPERFQKEKKIEKWFRRNCKWVLERECTSEEKGHFLVFLFNQ